MKIRRRLVSNSSSSSFAIFGYSTQLSWEDLYEKLTGIDVEELEEWDSIIDEIQGGESIKVKGISDTVSIKQTKESLLVGFYYGGSSDFIDDHKINFSQIDKDLAILGKKIGQSKRSKRLFCGIISC